MFASLLDMLSIKCNPDEVLPEKELITRFHSKTIPDIDIANYGKALLRRSRNPEQVMAVALVLMRRLPSIPQNSLTLHRLLLTVVLLGTKILQDESVSNRRWANEGGVSTNELNFLEVYALELLDWDCVVTEHEYAAIRRMTERFSQRAASLTASQMRGEHLFEVRAFVGELEDDLDRQLQDCKRENQAGLGYVAHPMDAADDTNNNDAMEVSTEDISLEFMQMSLGTTDKMAELVNSRHDAFVESMMNCESSPDVRHCHNAASAMVSSPPATCDSNHAMLLQHY